MKALLAATFALGLFAAAAQAEEASGVIVEIDTDNRQILLDDGQTYTLAEGVSIDGLEPGSEVMVSFEEAADGKVAVEVAPQQ
jgi:hypothetical protein